MKITSWSVMAGAALALVGCMDEDFNTPWLLNHARILAVQADPPQPSMGQSTTVRALVYQPPATSDAGAPEVVTGYHWSWCPMGTDAQDPSKCPIDQAMADMFFAGFPGVPKLDLGTSETATFTNPFPASMLQTLCVGDYRALPAVQQAVSKQGALANTGAFLFRCEIAGFPITIQLVVDVLVEGVPKQLPAIFKVFLPVNESIEPNHNPVVGALNLSEAGMKYPIDEAGTWSAVRGGEQPLLLDLPLSSSEPLPPWKTVYPEAKDDTDPHLKPHEQLNVFWYTEGGRFGANHRGGKMTAYYGGDPNDPVAPFSNLLENTLDPYKVDKYEGATARLYAVVLDKRGGVSWATGVLRLVDKAENRDGGMADAPPDSESPSDAATDSENDAGVATDSENDAGVVDAMVEALP